MSDQNSNEHPEQSADTAKHAVERLKVDTREHLSPVAYATAYASTEKNLDNLDTQLAFQKKLENFKLVIQKKARKNFLESGISSAERWWKEQGRLFQCDLRNDPEADFAWKDLVSFDKTNVQISGGLLAYDYLSGGLSGRVRDAKFEKKAMAKASLDVMKPYLIANMVLQPGVLAAGAFVARGVGQRGIKALEIPTNGIYGAVSGDLWQEVGRVGSGGNPLGYLWDGTNYHDRVWSDLKDPSLLEKPIKAKEHFDLQLQGLFTAIENYPKQPEKLKPHIPGAAEFVFRSAKLTMTEPEIKVLVNNLNAGVWDDASVRKGLLMSASGATLKFFLEKATPADRKLFLSDLQKNSAKKYPPSPFTEKDIKYKFPGIQAKMTPKEKKGIQSALDLGLSGMAAMVFLATTLVSKILFSDVVKNVFDFTDLATDGPTRVAGRVGNFIKKKSDKLAFQTTYQKDSFLASLKKGDYTKTIQGLGGKKGILTEKEVASLSGKNLTTLQKGNVIKELKKFQSDEKRGLENLTVAEFWDLPTIKKLKSSDFREVQK